MMDQIIYALFYLVFAMLLASAAGAMAFGWAMAVRKFLTWRPPRRPQ